MPQISSESLSAFVEALFEAAEVSPDEASTVADHLVDANLMGHDSHGVIRAPQYLDRIAAQELLPGRELRIIERRGAVLRMEGGGTFGQVIGAQATDAVCDLARELGAAMGVVRHARHVGRVGAYAERAVKAGFAAWLACSNSGVGWSVAPYGGTDCAIGPNPIVFGAPRAEGPPLVLDMTASVVAQGKIMHARAKGVPMPPGCIQDHEGRPSTDSDEYWNPERMGSILPLGGAAGHKGFGLGLWVEIFAGVLSGAGAAGSPRGGGHNALWIGAWSLERLGGAEGLARQIEAFANRVKSARPRDPNRPILLPGETEVRSRERRLAEGIPIEDATWAALVEKAETLGVPVPETTDTAERGSGRMSA